MSAGRPSKLSRVAALLVVWWSTSWLTVQGQTTNATCLSSFTWVDNSKGQSPCLVAAYLQGACLLGGDWTVSSIPGALLNYIGLSAIQASACTCSSVAYSMMSACAYCQGSLVPRWSDWITNCSSGQISNGQYPHAIPDGTTVPAWAFTTIVASDRWDFTNARAIANSNAPDSSAAGGPTSVSASTPTNTNGSGVDSGKHDNGKVNVGAIVGGVIGGLIGLVLLLVGGYLLYRHYRYRSRPTSIRPVLSPTPPPVPDEKLANPLTNSFISAPPPLRLYNPEDPSTYPDANLQPLLYSNQPAQTNMS